MVNIDIQPIDTFTLSGRQHNVIVSDQGGFTKISALCLLRISLKGQSALAHMSYLETMRVLSNQQGLQMYGNGVSSNCDWFKTKPKSNDK